MSIKKIIVVDNEEGNRVLQVQRVQRGRRRLRRFLAGAVLVSSAFPSRETRIQSLSDFTLEFLCIARNNLTRIASYLRKTMTKLCIKILIKADSAIESAFPYGQVPRRGG